jgi:FHS family L-fucose permease-like MFS transporter
MYRTKFTWRRNFITDSWQVDSFTTVVVTNIPYLRHNGCLLIQKVYIQFNMASTAITIPAETAASSKKNNLYVISVLGVLFFMLGFITWLNGTLIQFLKLVCQLKGDVQPFFVTTAFFMAYFVLAIPSSFILRITGYKKGMALGLFIMALGALIFIPAANRRSFGLFLTALFTQGMGFTLVQTAINPYVSIVGPLESAAKRMSIMGICNKLAGILSPIILGVVLLNNATKLENNIEAVVDPAQKAVLLNELSQKIISPYIVLTVVLIVLAILVYLSSLPEIKNEEKESNVEITAKTSVFKYPHLMLGIVCLFLYVGVEVMAGDIIGTYGRSLGLPLDETKSYTSYTLSFMLVGYVVGIITIPKYLSQQAALKYSAILGMVLSVLMFFTHGHVSIFFVALMGLANALMWPAIWPLTLKNLGRFTETAAALLIMGIAGGAIIPLLYGYLKGAPVHLSSQMSFLVCTLPAYLYILYYAVKGNLAK